MNNNNRSLLCASPFLFLICRNVLYEKAVVVAFVVVVDVVLVVLVVAEISAVAEILLYAVVFGVAVARVVLVVLVRGVASRRSFFSSRYLLDSHSYPWPAVAPPKRRKK